MYWGKGGWDCMALDRCGCCEVYLCLSRIPVEASVPSSTNARGVMIHDRSASTEWRHHPPIEIWLNTSIWDTILFFSHTTCSMVNINLIKKLAICFTKKITLLYMCIPQTTVSQARFESNLSYQQYTYLKPYPLLSLNDSSRCLSIYYI